MRNAALRLAHSCGIFFSEEGVIRQSGRPGRARDDGIARNFIGGAQGWLRWRRPVVAAGVTILLACRWAFRKAWDALQAEGISIPFPSSEVRGIEDRPLAAD